MFASSHARVRDARHWWRTQSESILPLVIIHFPISPFAGRSRSGSRPRRLKESVYILCGCPTSWKTMKMLAGCNFHTFKNGELRLKCNKLRGQYYFSGRSQPSCYPNLYLTCSVFISNHLAEDRSHRLSSTSVHTHTWVSARLHFGSYQPFLVSTKK